MSVFIQQKYFDKPSLNVKRLTMIAPQAGATGEDIGYVIASLADGMIEAYRWNGNMCSKQDCVCKGEFPNIKRGAVPVEVQMHGGDEIEAHQQMVKKYSQRLEAKASKPTAQGLKDQVHAELDKEAEKFATKPSPDCHCGVCDGKYAAEASAGDDDATMEWLKTLPIFANAKVQPGEGMFAVFREEGTISTGIVASNVDAEGRKLAITLMQKSVLSSVLGFTMTVVFDWFSKPYPKKSEVLALLATLPK